LQTGLGLGAGALVFGAGIASGERTETCDSFGTLSVGDGEFQLINNDWGSSAVDMCIYRTETGEYGYEWTERTTGGDPNYPQALLGTKPWGSDSGVASFPIRRDEIDEFEITIDVDIDIDGENWNLAEEWWLLEQPPDEETATHKYEIMLVLDWGDKHGHYMEKEAVWTDKFGNTVDYWANYDGGGTDADFHIFRIQGGISNGNVDLRRIVEFMSNRHDVRGDLFVSGVELGNEYWEGTTGTVSYHQFDVTINGTTYTSGDRGGDGDDGGNDGGDGDDGGNDGGGEGPCSGFDDWDSGTVYTGGDQVAFDDSLWEASWWTQGDKPGTSQWGPWEELESCGDNDGGDGSDGSDGGDGSDGSDGGDDDGTGPCADADSWSSGTVYTGGERATYDGSLWEASWWTRGDTPGSSQWGPWDEIDSC
jgi:hypothetical protein